MRILAGEWPPETDLVVLDELHKQPGWKSRLKGIWDTRTGNQRILVTGSSRLEVGGDTFYSLAGERRKPEAAR